MSGVMLDVEFYWGTAPLPSSLRSHFLLQRHVTDMDNVEFDAFLFAMPVSAYLKHQLLKVKHQLINFGEKNLYRKQLLIEIDTTNS